MYQVMEALLLLFSLLFAVFGLGFYAGITFPLTYKKKE